MCEYVWYYCVTYMMVESFLSLKWARQYNLTHGRLRHTARARARQSKIGEGGPEGGPDIDRMGSVPSECRTRKKTCSAHKNTMEHTKTRRNCPLT